MLRAQIQRQKRPRYVNVSHVGKRFHHRHRSRGVSVSRNIKRRLNVRRLISLKEEDMCFQRFLMLSLPAATYKRASISSGLKGGGSRSKQKNWDYTRLAKAISIISERNITSKKDLWYAIAQVYFGEFRVSKRKIDRLRTIWRTNGGNIRERVREVPVTSSEVDSICSVSTDTSEKEEAGGSVISETAKADPKPVRYAGESEKDKGKDKSDDMINKISSRLSGHEMFLNTDSGGKHLTDCHMADFLGSVIGSTVTSVYEKHFEKAHCQHHVSITGDGVKAKSSKPSQTSKVLTSENKQSSFHPSHTIQSMAKTKENSATSSGHVYDVMSDDCCCYESTSEVSQDSPHFVEIPCISGTTAKTLSGSNIPPSGIFRSKLKRALSLVLLPSEWRDIPVKHITGRSEQSDHRAFAGNYTAFFSNLLKKLNPYCCWVFKKNYIKKQDSRKRNSPYWRGNALCKYGDVGVDLVIEDRDQGVMKIKFSNDVEHDVTNPKAKRISGAKRSDLISDAWKTTANPSKMHRDQLLGIDSDFFAAGIRTGAGITCGTMKGIKEEANKQHQSDSNLAKSLSELQTTIANQDERDAIKLGQTWRKFFGYIQLCNIKPDLNIVLFNEASVRLYHELSARDIIYIDATGNLFAKETPYNRLLYYAMILRSPYPKNTPIPIVEYISSRHTAESIGLMIRKLKEKEKETFGCKEVTPALIMSDFSMAIIIASLREFNNESPEEFLERGYRIITGIATENEAIKTIHHVCSAHMMKLIKGHAKKCCEMNLSANSQIHFAMRFFGRLICSSTLKEMKSIVCLGHFIFKSRFVDNLLRNKLTEFSEHIHNFDFHETEDISDINCPENDDEDLDDDIDTERLTSSSIKQYWQKELADMKTNAVVEQAGHELNKYFMPKYFDYVVNNYLHTCVLWSRLLLGDLRRHNPIYNTKCSTTSSTNARSYLIDNNTNGQIEDFFKIKKNTSFKGRQNLRLDTFIGENWNDNKAMQREFVNAIVSGRKIRKKQDFCKIEKLCSTPAGTACNDNISAGLESDSGDEDNYEEGCHSINPEEQWSKPSPLRQTKSKGKYLTPTNKKLNFDPVLPSTQVIREEQKEKESKPITFSLYEKQLWPEVSGKIKGFQNIKKEIRKMWAKRNNHKKKLDSVPRNNKADISDQHLNERNEESESKNAIYDNQTLIQPTLAPRCICRQRINTNVIPCTMCRELFHCNCVNFCEGLAKVAEINYFCTNCIFSTFIPFVRHLMNSQPVADITTNKHLNVGTVSELYEEFYKNVHDTKCSSIPDLEYSVLACKKNLPDFLLPDVTECRRGIENKLSNCWLNSIFQCLSATYLPTLLEKWSASVGAPSFLHICLEFFEELKARAKITLL